MSKVLQAVKQLNQQYIRVNCELLFKRNLSDSSAEINHDIKKEFYQPKVQELLNQLTRMDFARVFRRRKLEKRLKNPQYKFMTSEQIEKEIELAKQRAEGKLQMPPVLPPRDEINEVLDVDEKLIGLAKSDANIIFTDISFGKTNRSRVIVVREPNGTLRKATWDERSKMNQIYFPVAGRKLRPHKVFNEGNLLSLCEKQEYLFVLDLACLQYEPDDPEYHRVTVTVYDHINENQNFDILRSTRHYGPLLFHVAAQRSIDNLIVENLQTDRLEDAVWAITLLHLLKPNCKSASTKYIPGEELKFIKSYIEQDSTKRGVLEMTLKAYLDSRNELPGIQKESVQ